MLHSCVEFLHLSSRIVLYQVAGCCGLKKEEEVDVHLQEDWAGMVAHWECRSKEPHSGYFRKSRCVCAYTFLIFY